MKNNPTLVNRLTEICSKYGYDFKACPSSVSPDFLSPYIYRSENSSAYDPDVFINYTKDYEIENLTIATASYGSVDYRTAEIISARLKNASTMIEEFLHAIE